MKKERNRITMVGIDFQCPNIEDPMLMLLPCLGNEFNEASNALISAAREFSVVKLVRIRS